MDEQESRTLEDFGKGAQNLRNKEEVEKILNLATQGDVEAQVRLGITYMEGETVPRDYQEAHKWLAKAADQCHPRGQAGLGVLYDNGLGVNQDYKQAAEWYRKAAEQGHANAQYYLGTMYDEGRGVAQDYVQAAEWYRKAADQYRKAAEQGNTLAQCDLADMYYDGRGVAQDYKEAFKWYRKSAEQGEPLAQNCLGIMYESGEGVPQDYTEALRWYRKAAEQGEPLAQNNLGVMYENGLGVAQDYKEGIKWFRKAAEQSCGIAQFNLGRVYLWGQAVPQDVDEVIKWYRLAAENGEREAENAIARIQAIPQGPGSDPKLQRVARLLLLFPRDDAEKNTEVWIPELEKGKRPSRKVANKLLLYCILDWQMHADTVREKARHFSEEVLPDPENLWNVITEVSEAEWKSKKQEYNLYRFTAAHMRVWYIGKDVVARYDGDARNIWEGRTPASVYERLMKLGKHGTGPNISNMIVVALIDAGQIQGVSDVKADTHVRRVLWRLLLGTEYKANESSEAVKMARNVYPSNPWLLDDPMWVHGRDICLKSDPKCKTCYLRAECAFFKRA